MIDSANQTLNANLPSATGFIQRKYAHTAVQNVVFLWTAQRAERSKWVNTGSQYQRQQEDTAE